MRGPTLTLLWCCATVVLGGCVQTSQEQPQAPELPARIRGLVAALDDPDDKVRAGARQSLREEKFQKEQVSRLGELLIVPDKRVRREAAAVLGAMGEAAKEHVPRLGGLLKDSDWEVRRAAAKALEAIGPAAKEQAPRLGDLLEDPDWVVRLAAIDALGAMGEAAKEQAPRLGELLKHSDWRIRLAAAQALGAMGPAAQGQVPRLGDLLKDSQEAVLLEAAKALGAMGPAAKEQAPRLGDLLSHSNAGIRVAAAEALGAMGPAAKEQAPLLVNMLAWEPSTQSAAKKALEAMGAAAKEQAPRLVSMLKDWDVGARAAAARLLGAMGAAAKEQAPRLGDLLKHPEKDVRARAAWVLGAMGEAAKEQAPLLISLLKDPDGEVRRAATKALETMGDAAKEQAPLLGALLKDPDEGVRQAAAMVLGALGTAAREQAPLLVDLLKDPNQVVRQAAAEALGGLGAAAREQAPRLVELLKNPNEGVQRAAADALGAMGEAAKEQTPRLGALLKHPNGRVRLAAAEALRAMGEAAREQTPSLVDQLKLPDKSVQFSAAMALRAMGKAAKEQTPLLIDLLKHPDEATRVAAANALGGMGEAVQEQAPRLGDLLKHPEKDVRARAAWVLGTMGDAAKDQTPLLIELLKDPEKGVREAAAKALGDCQSIAESRLPDASYWSTPANPKPSCLLVAMGEAAQKQAPRLGSLLKDPEKNIRLAAIGALGAMGEAAGEQVPSLGDLLSDPEREVREAAAKALGAIGEAAREQIPSLMGLLKDSEMSVRVAAVQALGAMGELDGDYAPLVLEFLLESGEERDRAGRLMMTMAPLELQQIATLLALAAGDPQRRSAWLLRAHVAGGGAPPVEHILRWVVGRSPSRLPKRLELAEARETLRAFAELWPHTEKHPALRDELAQQIARVAALANGQWESTDVELLELHETNMRASYRMYAENLQAARAALERWKRVKVIAWAWAGHICFWVLLLFFYPYSPQVQAFFFWNSRVRTITGFWYVGPLLTSFEPLRKRLLAPFARDLLGDFDPKKFPAQSYFTGSEVLIPSTGKRERLLDALPRLRGQVILEGASGLGKSLFIQYLLHDSKRLAVFLPAQHCEHGVLEAIQKKLEGLPQDTAFLQSIIYSGALDIYIDGLNEVTADTRSRIVQFVEHHFNGNILLATQRMEWTPPSTARLHVLQPLSKQQVSEFLASQLMQVEEKARQEYPARCARFIEEISSPQQPQGLSPAMSEALSNPMDLSVIAQMLAKGLCPDPLNLREQQYTLMAADYEADHKRDFPLRTFSEEAYKMRLEDHPSLSEERFKLELDHLKNDKIVVRREWRDPDGKEHHELRFRHDKLQEFFIAKTFLGENNPRIDKHMDDPRFRGVYLLLALRLELESARQLRDKLVHRAYQTHDYTLCDAFVTLFEARRKAEQAQV